MSAFRSFGYDCAMDVRDKITNLTCFMRTEFFSSFFWRSLTCAMSVFFFNGMPT